MITFDTFKLLVNSIHLAELECDSFNDSMERVLGNDTNSMYLKPLELINELVIDVLQTEFNESKDGAEWFVYEGINQINRGGTKITDISTKKEWNITSMKEYYDYLCSLSK